MPLTPIYKLEKSHRLLSIGYQEYKPANNPAPAKPRMPFINVLRFMIGKFERNRR
jgi:hypothetical protein